MKKTIALLLVLTMLLCAVASCSKKGSEGNNGTETEDNYTWPDNLDYTGYDGREFRILTWGNLGGTHWSANEFYYNEELTGDNLNNAVGERDRKLEEKLDVKVKYIEKQSGDLADYARNQIQAGADDFDLLAASITQSASLAQGGLLLDLYDFQDILNLDADYWDQSAREQLSVDHHLYFTVNDLTLVDKQATWVVFFTKGLLEMLPELTEGYDNGLYSMVLEGDWTIEAMHKMVTDVASDADGDGKMTEVDRYGCVGEQFNLGALMIGCGVRASRKNSDDLPEYCFTDNLDQTVTNYEMVHDIVIDERYSMTSGRLAGSIAGDVWTDGFGGMMENNMVLFNVTGMNRCALYRDLECEFGVIPLPKGSKDQENYQMLMSLGTADCVSIPMSVEDTDFVCTVLEAMTSLAHQTTYYEYFERALKYKYLPDVSRDDDSAEMLEIIFDNRVFDPLDVYGWGGGVSAVFGNNPGVSAVASAINAVKNYTTNAMNKKVEEFRKVYDRVKVE